MWSSDSLMTFTQLARNPHHEVTASCYRILGCLDALMASPTVTIHRDGKVTLSPNDKPHWDLLFMETGALNILMQRNQFTDLSPILETQSYKFQLFRLATGQQLNWLTPKGRIKMVFHNVKLSARPQSTPNQPRSH